ncbi:uncharacterized protein LOC133779348 [Humulus lupulus]|uniref:uncharacterized protein LOC133779348 n=1 Tax=Humulus lupulus TaxID=3486 RepID=UPI002B400D12|nr:uncharacterized protein LOC133779348 [Humulus lupulus]
MDKVTKDKSMVKFARVLVDVEISDKIPQCISFLNEKGQLMEQPIDFEWLPTRCSCCKNLGHGASNCKRSQEVQWKPKQVVTNAGIKDSDVSKIQSEADLVDGSIGIQMAGKDSQLGKTGSTLASTRELKTGNDSRDLSVQDTGNASVEQDLSWSTPKRVGGVKVKTAANVTVRGNKFSLLQESKEMVTKRNLHDPQSSNGGILGGFLETKMKNKKIEEMMMNLFAGWKLFSNEVVEGRILLVWREDIIQVNVIQIIDQLVHCEVRIKGSMHQTWLSFVYGRNTLEERKLLWPHLVCPQASVAPWLVMGDFNALFDYGDRIGGREITDSELADSRQWRASVLLNDLKSNSWFKPAGGFGLQKVLLKLKRLIPILSRFNKQQVGDVIQQYTTAKQRLEEAKYRLQQFPSLDSLQQEESDAARDFAIKSSSYESFLRQKSKINWLRFGDENTAYFHASLKQQKMRNRISSFINEEGHIVENYSEVIDHFYNHFRGVMGKVSLASRQIDQNCFIHGHTLSLEQQLNLTQPFTRKDVKRALFSIPSIKSPGPDGYGSGFFKALRRDIGAEVSDVILLFFTTGKIPTELNRTILTLIPKVDSPSVASDFRPIACCNTLYKCISKMICSRLA